MTVEQKSGEIKYAKGNTVVDLPGIYSINPYSSEEVVTRDFLLNGKPDGIINIVDATNIERNLYLTLQLLELNIPTIIALNMMDEVRASGGRVDTRRISEIIGVTVVPISAAKEGIAELVSTAVQTAENRMRPKIRDFCPEGRSTAAYMRCPTWWRTTQRNSACRRDMPQPDSLRGRQRQIRRESGAEQKRS